MKKGKRGITLTTITITIVIMAVLSSVVVVSTVSILNNTYEREFIREYTLVEAATKDYLIRKSGFLDFNTIDVDISSLSGVQKQQFDGEDIIQEKVTLYIVELNKIDVDDTTYGNNEDQKDRYLFSTKTDRLYYEKGFEIDGDIYYAIDNVNK